MWESEVSTEIDRPVEAVYGYLADFRRHSEWSHGVAAIEPLGNGTVAVGSEFRSTETVPGKYTSYCRVTELQPPRRIAWEAWDGRMMRTRWSFELAPNAGGTRLVQRCGFQPTNLLGTAMLNVMRKRQVPKENRKSLERIKAILEGDTLQGAVARRIAP